MPPANEMRPLSAGIGGVSARRRSASLSTIRALREKKADQLSGARVGPWPSPFLGATAGAAATATRGRTDSSTNVPWPTCERAQPAATSSS